MGVFICPLLMKKLFRFLLFLILLSSVCKAEDLNTFDNNDVTILYDNGLEKAALSTARIYPDVKNDLENKIGWEVDFKPVIYLVKTHESFQRISGHPLVVGFAVPEKMLIVIDYSKMASDPFSIASIMKHELCHLLLHKNIHGEKLTKWLDEGVSQWVSGGIADIIMADYSRIDSAVVTGGLIPFKYLTRSFPGDNEGLILAYTQSKSLVEYMANEYGPDGIPHLLNSLKTGNDVESAVSKSFSISFDELEKNWYSDVKKKATWLTILINHLYEIVFFLAAITLVIAYVKIVIRKRSERYDEGDES